LSSEQLTAEIDPLGAQLSVLRDQHGRDLLWNGDPTVWAGRAPLLFPIVGELAGGVYRFGGRAFPLRRHGFARGRRFEVIAATPASAVLRLEADAGTRAVYPFDFRLNVEFTLRDAMLEIRAHVGNEGDAPLYASFGFHPALRWPLPPSLGGGHFIEFELDEPGPLRRLNASGLLAPELHPTPIVNRRLWLDEALFRDDALIFDAVRSRSVLYGSDRGGQIRLKFPDAPYLGIWSKPPGGFICIEPWHGIADPVGFSGDFSQKPGVFRVEPHATLPIAMSLTVV
jgi:galactose mutarotase-like enzyme